VSTQDGDHILIRIYRHKDNNSDQPLPAYIFYHGGGYLFGTLSSEDAACARIAVSLPVAVVNICYRHTPEFTYPTAHNDAWAAFEWAITNAHSLQIDKRQLVVGGISAGGGLASSVVLRHTRKLTTSDAKAVTSQAVILGQLLCIPWLIHRDAYPSKRFASPDRNSYNQCASAPVLPMYQLNMFTDLLECKTPNDPLLISPGLLSGSQASSLPKTAIVVAGNDPLRDDGLMMATDLQDHGLVTLLDTSS
jgi:acetyl esterase/lipase